MFYTIPFEVYTVLVSLAIILILWLSTRRKAKNVCVVVLGDVGRSPRMQNHALSFAKEGYQVDVVGYTGSAPLNELTEHPNVQMRYMKPPPNLQERLPRLVFYGLKVIWQSVTLLTVLVVKRRSSYLLLQNPPAIPTMPICWLYCMLMRVQLTIDWHNYAHTIQALSSGCEDAFVRITKYIEFTFGRLAASNFCVSEAMRADLQKKWNIKAKVLYDRPSQEFHPISLLEKHNLMLNLGETYSIVKGQKKNSTVFTDCSEDGQVTLRRDRPALLVSSTSWTQDEDFGILIAALQEYEDAYGTEELMLPDIICFVTGKGPLKEFWTAIIKRRNWQHVEVITPWLENEDYPKLLASADLGICLHTSSSGLDLPMKLVDMFGSGLPALAFNYKCLDELLVHKTNGMVFADEKDLAQLLLKWFENFPDNKDQQLEDKKFREQLMIYQKQRWHDYWLANAAPIYLYSEFLPTRTVKDGLYGYKVLCRIMCLNLRFQLGSFIHGDRASNHRSGNATGTTQGSFTPNKNIGDVLVLAKQRKMHLIGSLAELLVIHSLLHQVEDLCCQGGVSQRISLGIYLITMELRYFVFLISLLAVYFSSLSNANSSSIVNLQPDTPSDKPLTTDRPIIGILAQEISYYLNRSYPNQYDSFIAASYVKFVEGAGALVVPIWIGKGESYYEDILSKVNGVLWPGGSSYFNVSKGYAEAGAIIYRIATRMNNEGIYFPIWGTCLGFELLTYVAAGGVEHRSACSSKNQALPLEFVSGYESSRMFENAPPLIIDILSQNHVTGNYHQYCVTRDDLKRVNLESKFKVLSINHDWNGFEFISAIEHVSLPFYGVQFHPEKNLYEWVRKTNITHSFEASLASQYFANFFVEEARKNLNSFPNNSDLEYLIYNYPITFTAPKSSYLQCYLFSNCSKNE
ncbi:uncharacterized protein LOC105689661 [Athalia rosae]|uniref:uncharacterized protein LOC105689661 n=1 Tax=Athalia rosae TaxID=37344 RepID=UPI0020343C19|nr:uncharacterized protein LOC105689661 [Athalia rosae]